jgi:hypothetical protein
LEENNREGGYTGVVFLEFYSIFITKLCENFGRGGESTFILLYSPSPLCATMKKQVFNKNGLWKNRNRNEVLPVWKVVCIITKVVGRR